ncbi:helix-turn-helix transcriptional regulator [Paracoccus aminovorans]|uniref:helix-turn-helix transcriptional regulator n=1 Tax=Paracoccus aminovorans TaxID=34004 RepID=UPI000C26C8D1|nr:AlpA family phage regulatory protein [Paracoccus aminovorans]
MAGRPPESIFDFVAGITAHARNKPHQEGTFPPQIKISTNGAGWKESDINRWVADPTGWRQRSFKEFDFLDDF